MDYVKIRTMRADKYGKIPRMGSGEYDSVLKRSKEIVRDVFSGEDVEGCMSVLKQLWEEFQELDVKDQKIKRLEKSLAETGKTYFKLRSLLIKINKMK